MSRIRKPIILDELPENVVEIVEGKYWIDKDNRRVIRKLKRAKQYRVVQPIIDKWHDEGGYIRLYINGQRIFKNYNLLLEQYIK